MIADLLMNSGLPLASLVQTGPIYSIGELGIPSSLVNRDIENGVLVMERDGIRITSKFNIAESVLTISHKLENNSTFQSKPFTVIEPLRLMFNIKSEEWTHVYCNGGTSEAFYPPLAFRTHERSKSWKQSPQDSFQHHPPFTIDSDPGGRSSNKHLPILLSVANCIDEKPGLFCGMEWSGGWYIKFERVDDGKSCLVAGLKIGRLQLDPGEGLELPTVHLGLFSGGTSAATNHLRKYLHKNICPKYLGEPILPPASYDHYFGIGNDFDGSLMKMEADRAAELGLEFFVVDAVWFKGGFPHGAGNWNTVDVGKFPDGLEPLSRYVRDLGMGFGIWFEPERAVKGTTILNEHPEWFVPVDQPYYEPQNYNIDMSISDAQDYVIEMISGWVDRLDLSWIRWDYNINPDVLWSVVDPSHKLEFAYIQGLYRVLDTLISKYPSLMIDSCSSGGRRIDMGTIRRGHTFWISDRSEDPMICRYMQARANRFLPGNLLNSAVVVNRNQGDEGFGDTSILSRMLGALSFNGDIASWSSKLTESVRGWVDIYKSIRILLVQDFFQLLPLPTSIDDWDALQFISYSRESFVIFVFAGQIGGTKTVFPKQLDGNSIYRVTRTHIGYIGSFTGFEIMSDGLSVKLDAYEGGLWQATLEI